MQVVRGALKTQIMITSQDKDIFGSGVAFSTGDILFIVAFLLWENIILGVVMVWFNMPVVIALALLLSHFCYLETKVCLLFNLLDFI